MSERPILVEIKNKPLSNEEIYHFFCCDEARGMCGTDLRNHTQPQPTRRNVCKMCQLLSANDLGCALCGGLPDDE